MIRALVIFCVSALALPALASDLTLPNGAKTLAQRHSPLARYALPLGPAADDSVPVRYFEGQVLRRTWRAGGDATSLQLFAPMRQQLEDAGYDILFQCQAQDCGGFDFRFGIEVVPAPDMTVAIGDYLFLSALKGDEQALSLLVSRSRGASYIQVIEVTPPETDPIDVTPPKPTMPVTEPDQTVEPEERGLFTVLTNNGRVVLENLEFDSGSARLGSGPFESLVRLAEVLRDNPEMHISLVGHTDNVGAQDKNISLSRRRATAVRERLHETYDIDVNRIDVAGVGYMAPLTSNLTPQGREANRRVEAVLLNR